MALGTSRSCFSKTRWRCLFVVCGAAGALLISPIRRVDDGNTLAWLTGSRMLFALAENGECRSFHEVTPVPHAIERGEYSRCCPHLHCGLVRLLLWRGAGRGSLLTPARARHVIFAIRAVRWNRQPGDVCHRAGPVVRFLHRVSLLILAGASAAAAWRVAGLARAILFMVTDGNLKERVGLVHMRRSFALPPQLGCIPSRLRRLRPERRARDRRRT